MGIDEVTPAAEKKKRLMLPKLTESKRDDFLLRETIELGERKQRLLQFLDERNCGPYNIEGALGG